MTFSAHLLSAGGSTAAGKTLMPGAQMTTLAKGDHNANLKKWASKTLPALKHQLELVQNPDNSK
jgi:hypothetical protein